MCLGHRSPFPDSSAPLWTPLTSFGRAPRHSASEAGFRRAPGALTALAPLVARPAVYPEGPAAFGFDARDDMSTSSTLGCTHPWFSSVGAGSKEVCSSEPPNPCEHLPVPNHGTRAMFSPEDTRCQPGRQRRVRSRNRPGLPEGLNPDLLPPAAPLRSEPTLVGRPGSVRVRRRGEPPPLRGQAPSFADPRYRPRSVMRWRVVESPLRNLANRCLRW
jgi:hypothetical protein